MVSLDDYNMGCRIGKGAFGKVYICRDMKNRKCAIKMIKDEDRFRKAALKEIKFLKKLNSNKIVNEEYEKTYSNKSYIVDFYGEFIENNIQYLVFEYLDIDLYKYYLDNELSFEDICKIGYQVINGIEFFHNLNIIHADLKPENIMISKKTKDIKIIDFGSAIEDLYPKKSEVYIQSRYYRAPEVLYGVNYGKEIDIWSFGCIIYELFFRNPLFPGKNIKDMIFLISGFIDIPYNLNYYSNTKVFSDCFKKELEYNNCGVDSDSDVDLGCENEYYTFKYCSNTANKKYRLPGYNFKYILNYKLRPKCKHYQKKNFIDMLSSIIRYDYFNRPKAKDIKNANIFLEYKLGF